MINDLWYKNAIIYCLSVGTFMDANGDGVGDFQGLMRRLDYLQGLGITAIWLMPFQTSPGRDDGYDVADYYNVDPRYGTLGDFVEFTHGAKQRGMRVMIDLVVNHTSDQHPLVPGGARAIRSRSIATGTSGRRRSRANANDGMVFPGVQKSTWTLRQGREGLVLPPLLRFPARPQHVEPAGAGRDPQDHGLLDPARRLRLPHGRRAVRHRDQGRRGRASRSSSTTCCARSASSCSGAQGDAIILAEANVLPDTDMEYFGDDGERMQMMFNFQVNQHLFYALATADTRPLEQGAEGDEAAAGDRAVGPVPAQPRRARSRPAHREQRETVFAAFGPNKTCSSTTAASAAASRRCSTATAAGSSSPTA